jgi:hypothetical protein
MKKLMMICAMLIGVTLNVEAFNYDTYSDSFNATNVSYDYENFSYDFSGYSDVLMTNTFTPAFAHIMLRLSYPQHNGTSYLDVTNGVTTVGSNSSTWSAIISRTNFPPTTIYFAEYLGFESQATNVPARVLAAGRVNIHYSIYQGTAAAGYTNPLQGQIIIGVVGTNGLMAQDMYDPTGAQLPVVFTNDSRLSDTRVPTAAWQNIINASTNQTVVNSNTFYAVDVSLATQINTNTASITNEAALRTAADSSLTMQVSTNKASITNEAALRILADASLTSQIGTNTASITNEAALRIVGDNTGTNYTYAVSNALRTALSSATNQTLANSNALNAVDVSLTAQIVSNDTDIAAGFTTQIQHTASITSLTSQINTNTASITNEAANRAAADIVGTNYTYGVSNVLHVVDTNLQDQITAIGNAYSTNSYLFPRLVVSDPTQQGGEMVTNGSFTSDSGGWILTNAYWSGGHMYVNAGLTATITQSNTTAITNGRIYVVRVTKGTTNGTLSTFFAGNSTTNMALGVNSNNLVCMNASNDLVITCTGGGAGTWIDDVSIKQITNGSAYVAGDLYVGGNFIGTHAYALSSEVTAEADRAQVAEALMVQTNVYTNAVNIFGNNHIWKASYTNLVPALAAATYGDTLILSPGIHVAGTFSFPSNICVIGQGVDNTIISNTAADSAFKLSPGSIYFRNIYFKGHGQTTLPMFPLVNSTASTDVHFDNCIATNLTVSSPTTCFSSYNNTNDFYLNSSTIYGQFYRVSDTFGKVRLYISGLSYFENPTSEYGGGATNYYGASETNYFGLSTHVGDVVAHSIWLPGNYPNDGRLNLGNNTNTYVADQGAPGVPTWYLYVNGVNTLRSYSNIVELFQGMAFYNNPVGGEGLDMQGRIIDSLANGTNDEAVNYYQLTNAVSGMVSNNQQGVTFGGQITSAATAGNSTQLLGQVAGYYRLAQTITNAPFNTVGLGVMCLGTNYNGSNGVFWAVGTTNYIMTFP